MSKTIILVMGIPGAGKTTFANTLSCELAGIPVICTDIVKAAFEDKDPVILSKVSHNAWELFGEPSDANIIKGYKLFSKTLFKYSYELAQKLLKTYNTVIIEGLGIDAAMLPLLPENSIKVLIRNPQREKGYINKLTFRNSKNNNWEKSSHNLSLIEDYIESTLKSQANFISCEVDESKDVIEKIKKDLKHHLEETI